MTSYMHKGPTGVKGHMQIVLRLSLCSCKSGFAKLPVDYSEKSEDIDSLIALSKMNNAFGVHSDNVQDWEWPGNKASQMYQQIPQTSQLDTI